MKTLIKSLVFTFYLATSLQAIEEHKIVLQVPEQNGKIITRNGELVVCPEAKATVILVHAFKGDKNQTKTFRVLFPQCNTVVFDFRAHGDKREGQCCSFGMNEVADLKAAADFVRNHPDLKKVPLFAYGASMGAATIIETQAQHNLFDGIIVDSPFESMEDVIKRGLSKIHYELFGKDILRPIRRILERNMFSPVVDKALKYIMRVNTGMTSDQVVTCLKPVRPIDSIQHVTVPMLMIGCNQDTLTPPEGVRKMYDIAKRPNVQLWLTDGRGHVDSYFSHPEEYTTRINDFITSAIRGSGKSKFYQRIQGFFS